jgi:hypothetical protein
MFLGDSIVVWVLRLIVAAIVFYLAMWLLPLLCSALGVSPPSPLILLISLALALGVLCERYWLRRRVA